MPSAPVLFRRLDRPRAGAALVSTLGLVALVGCVGTVEPRTGSREAAHDGGTHAPSDSGAQGRDDGGARPDAPDASAPHTDGSSAPLDAAINTPDAGTPDEPTIDPEGDGDFVLHGPYAYGPDSLPDANVPKGTLTEHTFAASQIYPGTTRKFWVYLPADYDGETPLALMVFQDGNSYVGANSQPRAITVLDNLIFQGRVPRLVGLFIDPGVKSDGGKNRGFEYDRLTDDYVRFVLEEMLPEAQRLHRFTLLEGAENRAIGGLSSGGICAFTAGWQRPDAFGRILTYSGSFVRIAGGDAYPQLVADTPRKALRVFLTSGATDLDNEFGKWADANAAMARELAAKGYHYRYVFGDGGHPYSENGTTFPDAMAWLWREPLEDALTR